MARRTWWLGVMGTTGLRPWLWWVADDITVGDGNPVDVWPERIHGTDVEASGSARPTLREADLNGHHTVEFDGIDDVMVAPGTIDAWFRSLSPTGVAPAYTFPPRNGMWTAFAVARATAFGGLLLNSDTLANVPGYPRRSQAIGIDSSAGWWSGANSTDLESSGNSTLDAWLIVEVVRDQWTIEAFVNGTGNGSTATTAEAAEAGGGIDIGAHATLGIAFFKGKCAEIVVYNEALASSERTAIRTLLAATYGL